MGRLLYSRHHVTLQINCINYAYYIKLYRSYNSNNKILKINKSITLTWNAPGTSTPNTVNDASKNIDINIIFIYYIYFLINVRPNGTIINIWNWKLTQITFLPVIWLKITAIIIDNVLSITDNITRH